MPNQPDPVRVRKRRRAVRAAAGPSTPADDATNAASGVTAPPTQTRDDTDAGWGEISAGTEEAQDRWLRDQRPPHHGD